MGSDCWGRSELAGLPRCANVNIVKALNESLEQIAIPHQLLLNLNACLGKPSGDTRTITKTPMLYRMAMRADEEIKEWESQTESKFDTATKGSSALIAALKRNLAAEIAMWLGDLSLAVFNDFEKFFDSIDIPKLLEQAVLTQFPARKLAFLIQQHVCPRVIQANGFTSKAVSIFRSIIAGCLSSVALTRVYTKNAIADIDNKHPKSNTNVFVDDTCMQATGRTIEDVLEIIVPAVSMFGDKVRALKLSLSPKAAVCGSIPKLAQIFQHEMKHNYNMQFLINECARDLGVTHTAAKTRPSKFVLSRFNKKVRINKVKNIAKVSRKARKLFTGSCFAASTWGHQASSLSDTALLELERDALNCAGIQTAGRCRVTALMVCYGIQGSPKARIVRETIQAWFKLLRLADSNTISKIKQAWPIAVEAVKQPNGIQNVKGIMSNLILFLIKAGWFPTNLFSWKDPREANWTMSGVTTSPDIVAAAVIKDLFDIDLKRGANHYNGKGIEKGIHYNATVRVLRNFKEQDYKHKCLLENIIAAATWPAKRINDVNGEFPASCTRCGELIDDALHCYWTCPANKNIDNIDIENSNYLVPIAEQKAIDYPCLWLRGILPDGFINIPPDNAPVEQTTYTYIEPENFCISSGTYYGDASGGEHTKYPDIRRVGCAFIALDSSDQLRCGAHFPLPGEIQTVARGELYALVCLLKHADQLAEIDFVTDNKGVRDVYNKGPKDAAFSSNCDLFRETFQIIIKKALKVTVRWMPSHLATKPNVVRPDDVTDSDIKGNDLADHYAGLSAEAFQVPLNIAIQCKHYYKLVKRIQKRIIAVISNLPERKKYVTVNTTKELVKTLDDRIKESMHSIQRSNNRIYCTVCKNDFRLGDQSLHPWLKGPCTELTYDNRPNRIDNELLHVGNQNVHSSHRLSVHRGLVYCHKCGCRKGTHIKKMAHSCEPPTKYGRDCLQAIANDVRPPNLAEWPG